MRAKASPTLVHVYAQNTHYRLAATDKFADSYFGGPVEMEMKGKKFGPEALHQVVLLSPTDIPVLLEHHLHLPLYYGMRYSGCQLTYHLKSFLEIEILNVSPKAPSKDWPYANYPKQLPYVQLEVKDSTRCSWKKFSAPIPNAPDKLPGDLFVVVPPPSSIGMSLWGRDGDLELVSIVWEFDAKSLTVRSYNVCT